MIQPETDRHFIRRDIKKRKYIIQRLSARLFYFTLILFLPATLMPQSQPGVKFAYSTSKIGLITPDHWEGSLYRDEYRLILYDLPTLADIKGTFDVVHLELGYCVTEGDLSLGQEINDEVVYDISDVASQAIFLGIGWQDDEDEGFQSVLRLGLGKESYKKNDILHTSNGIFTDFGARLFLPIGRFTAGLGCGFSCIFNRTRMDYSDINMYFGLDLSCDFGRVPKKPLVRRSRPPVPAVPRDHSKPTIQLYSPQTVQNIYRTEEPFVLVRGKATDREGIALVKVNARDVRIQQDGTFAHRVKLKSGKNIIKVVAIDINNNSGDREFYVIRQEFAEDEGLSDVDIPPAARRSNKNGIAVVFGIEEYQYAPAVSYAYSDADIFREYLVSTFGYPRENIYYKMNQRATKGEFEKVFSLNGWLANHATSKSEIIIFFAGHGAPDLATKESYLVPSDIDPNYSPGYSLNELYANLAKINAKSITVILDACFSGGTRENKPLLAGSRPVYISVDAGSVPRNTLVFTAASGNEISSAYKQKSHGLFTYYFLKGLNGEADRNRDRRITATEMQHYLDNNVPVQARRMGREQHPHLIGAGKERILLRY